MRELLRMPARQVLRPGRLVILLLMVLLPQGATAHEGSAPSVGEIVIDSYNCETGQLDFHVYVENLHSVPEGTSGFDYPLQYTYTSYYSNGTEYFPGRQAVWSPTAEQDPYTGDVYLTVVAPTENVYGEPGTGVITSIDLYVAVGEFVGEYWQETDSASTTYIVDCTTPPSLDSDGDGVDDSLDICPGGNDTIDTDSDGTPDACDATPNGESTGGGVSEDPGVPGHVTLPGNAQAPEDAGPPAERGRPENPGKKK